MRHMIANTIGVPLLLVASLGLTGCAEDEPTDGDAGTSVGAVQDSAETDVEYDGPYDETFEAEVGSYEGEKVRVTAEAEQILSDHAFLLAGEPYVDPLVVVHDKPLPDLEAEQTVSVVGIVHKSFDVPHAEDQLDIDMDDVVYENFEAEPYIEALEVELDAVPAPAD